MKGKFKKIFTMILAASMVLVTFGCDFMPPPSSNSSSLTESESESESSSSTEVEAEKTLTVEEVLASAKAEDLTSDSYDVTKYTTPYWESQIVYNETLIPYRDQEGNAVERELMFPIAKVLEVRSNDLQTLYEEGRDYIVTEEGKLFFPQGTKIPVVNFDSIYAKEANFSGFTSIAYPGRYIQTGINVVKMQISVTYIRTEGFPQNLIPEYAGEQLATTVEKLENKQPVSIVLFGDSISTGNASSGYFQIAPNAPIFSAMLQEKLRLQFGYDEITVHNCATGGWTAIDGRNNISRVFSCSPDLVLLAFGMNDGGGDKSNAAANNFYTNYIFMMEKTWEQFPKCEFMLVTSVLPNPDAYDQTGKPALSNHKDFRRVANDIAEEYADEKVAVCDVLSIHEWMLTRKAFMDMGDNYNHPSDFAARLYVQAISAKLF